MINRLLSCTAKFLIRCYQIIIKPYLPPSCRHTPGCSDYMKEAISIHGFFSGSFLGIKRILKCHPGGSAGYDPVPLRINKTMKGR